jgi:hypothetical protein
MYQTDARFSHFIIILFLFRIFGPKMEEGACACRRLHNEELRNLYASPVISWVIIQRKMRWVGHIARIVEINNVYNILVGIPERKRPLGRPRHRWEGNISMDRREVR